MNLLTACMGRQTSWHYPYFTLWVSLTQLLIFVASLGAFGFAPVGISAVLKTYASVTDRNGLPLRVCAIDYNNLFLGPRMSDLIRVGAKYSLCMRRYDMLYEKILEPQRRAEAASGCCVQNDGSACYQSLKSGCPEKLSTWLKWTNSSPGPDARVSGPVCGQDPRTCEDPRSLPGDSQWPDRVTEWPPCNRQQPVPPVPGALHHLTCQVSAWPCCVGVKGECVIASPSRCELLRGVLFPDRQLCSQVNCMAVSCGALGVSDAEHPGQLYRLVLSLFLHSSVVNMLITLLHHYFYLRHLERLAGWLKTAGIYIGSGIFGNLVSAWAMPLSVHVGPSAAQIGALAAVAVELFAAWRHIENRLTSCAILAGCLLALLVLGALPWFDAFANLAGLASGCLLGYGLLPHLNHCDAMTDAAASAAEEREAESSDGGLWHRLVTVMHKGRRRGLVRLAACLGAWCAVTIPLLAVFCAPLAAGLPVCAWCRFANCFFLWLAAAFPEGSLAGYCSSFDDAMELSNVDCLSTDRY